MWRIGLAAGFASLALASPARACVPLPIEPPLPGESDEAYKIRVDTLQRERAAQWLKERQAGDLQRAEVIFIARDTWWSPPYRPRMRNGRPVPPVMPTYPYATASYFKPIAWFRGPRTTALLKVTHANTSCGPMSIGDTTFSQPPQLFVFFARKGPLSEKTLIDAIAVDSINDPALAEFVAKYRKPQAGAALSPR